MAELLRLAIEQRGELLDIGEGKDLGNPPLQELVQIGCVAADGEGRLAHGESPAPKQIPGFFPYGVALHGGFLAAVSLRLTYPLNETIVNDMCSAYVPFHDHRH